MKRIWKRTDLKFIRENIHLTDRELAEKFNTTGKAVERIRERHNIYKQKIKQTA